MIHQDLSRVVLHLDFDSYYTQVEMKRLGIPREVPCAVQQWEGLIAVNYPARAKGVTRHMRVKEARKICPELVLVHVETIGGSSSGGNTGGSGEAGAAAAAAGGEEGAAAGSSRAGGGGSSSGGQVTNRLTQKACLERYRRSTAEVLALLHRLAPAAVIEKASIDEVYMDVTGMVDKEVQSQEGSSAQPDAFAWGSVVIGGPLDVSSEFERRLAVGAGIACRLRGALLRDMGYTASAGIAANKLLAKVGSAMHKPNQQTVIPPRAAQQVMQDLPLKKLGGFGGKLGEQLAALGCTTAGQVQQLSHATLVLHFGAERATAIEQAVRGISHDPVQERERPKSMLAAKSFNPTSDPAALQNWFHVLAQELAGRMSADEAQYRRRPRNLVVHYRGGAHANTERSKSCPMPRFSASGISADTITETAYHLFKSKCAGEALPCSRLAISAADFVDLPAANNSSAITRFLQPKLTAAAAAAADGGSGSGEAVRAQHEADQQLPAAQQPLQYPQQKQQQQRRQGSSSAATAAGHAAGSIVGMFQRAQKRQRLDSEAQQEQQRDQKEEQQEQQEQQFQQQVAGSEHDKAAGQHSERADAHAAMAGASETPVKPSAAPIPVAELGSLPATLASVETSAQGGKALAEWHQATVEAAAGAPAAAAGETADAAGEAAGAPAAAADEAAGGGEEDELLLAGVDVEEQRRILTDIRMLQHLNRNSSSSTRPGPVGRDTGGAGRPAGAGGGRQGPRPAGKRQPVQQQQQKGIAAFFQQCNKK